MWGWVKKTVKKVWDGVSGFVSSLWTGFKWFVHRAIGIIEYISTLFGIMPEKKLRVSIKILLDNDLRPLADREKVERVLALAREVFKEQAHVRIVSPTGDEESIISLHPEPAPEYVLDPLCDAGGYGQIFTRVGRWFRRYSARTPAGSFFGYGSPATIYVVRDVQEADGCFLAIATNYGYIDSGALDRTEEGWLLVLAHELGHACDLRHRGGKTLMKKHPDGRPRRLIRRQKATLRSSPRVTYL
jgi:hypothetical protein